MPPLRSCFLFILMLISPICQAAWVKKSRCGSSHPSAPSDSPFWIDSLHGTFDTFDASIVLSLSLLGVHNQSRFSCNDLNLTGFETDLRFHVLGLPVGQVDAFRSQCPLPITETLTPPEGLLFSQYELIYSLSPAHQLQTLAAEFSMKTHNGVELDCAGANITPEIGTTASAALTYTPAGVMVLVGIASWHRHFHKLGRNSPFEYSTARISHDPVREIIFDLTDYLRYIQFIFLAGSLSIEYPGFYQPIVGHLAWSSLLYWTGPINHGFSYAGVEDGMYVSNASYGLEHMAQMVGFPQVPDIMLDAFINLFILVSALILTLLTLCLITSNQLPPLSAMIRQAGWIILSMTLPFFSFPLLSYMSYEMILIGYLPNYHLTLVGVAMAVLVCSNYLNVRQYEKEKEQSATSSIGLSLQDDQSTGSRELLRCFTFLPQAIQLLQGIMIGGLQNWGLVQLLVLGACEVIVLLHMILQPHSRFLFSKSIWCAAVRLLTLSLSIAFARRSSETEKQWIGYIILCLHAVIIFFGFLVDSAWQLFRAAWKRIDGKQTSSMDRADHAHALPRVTLTELSPDARDHNTVYKLEHNCDKNGRLSSFRYPGPSGTFYRGFDDEDHHDNNNIMIPLSSAPADRKRNITGYSAFYRPPRPGIRNHVVEPDASSQESDSINSARGLSEEIYYHPDSARRRRDTLDELLEVPARDDVDYSVRESDFYYGRPAGDSAPPPTSIPLEDPGKEQTGRGTLYEWTYRTVARLKGSKPKEKGFQVVRPPRPT
ncbi:hypothetical protein IFM58399_09417 [Aspergillus lentulus]|uniref:uncharacterized protein n=1 Tax=Aspergillus lentulus TaxID=293939 RepID=UPI001393AB83|nr:uncharacterized protein IFM58399_09417 [Aspergillus lentulus]GFF52799.1 hypothetical protein IFM58399_09417 [Aspergillus lentulus]